MATGTDLVHVAYKGSAPALTDLIAGQVQIMFGTMPATLPQAKSGKLRAIVVYDTERTAKMPDVPAITESLPGFEPLNSWVGFLGPARLPRDIVNRWREEVRRAASDPENKAKLEASGQTVIAGSPEQLAADIKKQLAVVKNLIVESGIKPQF